MKAPALIKRCRSTITHRRCRTRNRRRLLRQSFLTRSMGAPIKSDELFSQWSRKLWKPHYLFTGQEDFLIEQAYEQALHHWLGEKPDSMSLERLDAESQSVDEIVQAAQTVS